MHPFLEQNSTGTRRGPSHPEVDGACPLHEALVGPDDGVDVQVSAERPAVCQGPEVEAQGAQQLHAPQKGGLVLAAGHAQSLLQIPAAQGVQHPPVHQLLPEGLPVRGQPQAAQPLPAHPGVRHQAHLGVRAATDGVCVVNLQLYEGALAFAVV